MSSSLAIPSYLCKKNAMYLCAVGGFFYVFHTAFDYIKTTYKERKEYKQMLEILETEKNNMNIPELIKSNQNSVDLKDSIFYIYYKILHTVFKSEYREFDKKRRHIFSQSNNLETYITYVEEFYTKLKSIENKIFQFIYEELNINPSNDIIKYESIDMGKIRRRYCSESDLEVPAGLDVDKLEEIVHTLKEKMILYQPKVRECLNDDTIDNEQLIVEHLAFDYVYHKYNVEQFQIEKAFQQNNLMLVDSSRI